MSEVRAPVGSTHSRSRGGQAIDGSQATNGAAEGPTEDARSHLARSPRTAGDIPDEGCREAWASSVLRQQGRARGPAIRLLRASGVLPESWNLVLAGRPGDRRRAIVLTGSESPCAL